MKKIIEKILLTVLILTTFVQVASAQKPIPKNGGKPKDTKVKTDTTLSKPVHVDTTHAFNDSIEYISNRDLLWINEMIKKVMTSDDYKKAGDVISQYQLLIGNMNQIVNACIMRWQLRQEAIKPEPEKNKVNLP